VLNFNGSTGLKEIVAKAMVPDFYINKPDKGIVGIISGIIGLLQANEVIKILIETGDILSNKILKFNGLNNEFIVEQV
jgi:molybdopterin/thiamine biosynthesis adenylyltransferase